MGKLLTILIIAGPLLGAGELQQRKVNVREACRRAISGEYLKHYDTMVSAKSFVTSLTIKLDALDAARKTYKRTYLEKKAKAESNEYDLAAAKERDDAHAKFLSAEGSIGQYEEMVVAANKKKDAAKAQADRILKSMLTVFKLVKRKTMTEGAYPHELQYKAPCPKYHALCPLPENYSNLLLKIKVEGETPEACKRYASFSRIR